MKKKELDKARKKEVWKSNSLIQKGRHKYTNRQQKAILYICSMINPSIEKQQYIFDINNFTAICGFQKSGKTYAEIKDDLQVISNKSWWAPIYDEKYGKGETLVSFLDEVTVFPDSGKINIAINKLVVPYMVKLQENFTKYELYNVLGLSGDYAIILYEEFKSRQAMGQWILTVDDFKKTLMVEKIKSYEKWAEVKRIIINPALKQINEFTDLQIAYKDDGKRGRKATKLCFVINSKEPLERLVTENHVYEVIDKSKKLEVKAELDADFSDFIKNNKEKYSTPRKKKIADKI